MKFTNELRGVKSRLLLFSVLLLIPVMMFAQSITVKGTVLDSAGEAVIGASVVEKGNPSNGTITDFDGKFTLAVSKGKRIVISFVGYETQEVDAVTGKELTITLQDDSQALEEVVVLGYSSRARKDLTGSVGSVSGVKIAAVLSYFQPARALQEKIAGGNSWPMVPPGDINIRVRGGTSVTQSNDPLYIVDGFLGADNINDIPTRYRLLMYWKDV